MKSEQGSKINTYFQHKNTMFLNEHTNTSGEKVIITPHKLNFYIFIGINICFRPNINSRHKKLYSI